jgi:hypothetical protein
MQVSLVAPDRDLHVVCRAGLEGMRDDVGDCLLQAQLQRVCRARRHFEARDKPLDPWRQSRDLRAVIAQRQAVSFMHRSQASAHAGADAAANAASLSR